MSLTRFLELTLSGKAPQDAAATVGGVQINWITEGVLEVTPADGQDTGLDFLISAGVHGNETAPIELLDSIVKKLVSGQLKPRARLFFVLANPESMRVNKRYVENDMNRMFNGRHTNYAGFEAKRAAELESLSTDFFTKAPAGKRVRLHYDMHTAIRGSKVEKFAVYPFAEGRQQSLKELSRLSAAGIQAVLLQTKPNITYSSFTYAKLGAEAFTLELGKARPFGQNQCLDLSVLEARLEAIIEAREPALSSNLGDLQLYQVSRELIKHSDAFKFHLADDVENFSEMAKDFVLADDVVNGAPEPFVITEAGARIIFPNPKVANGLRASLIIVPTTEQSHIRMDVDLQAEESKVSTGENKSELQKSLAGELYDAMDPELAAMRVRAREFVHVFNTGVSNQPNVLRPLFGACGPKLTIEPPFRCDYGCHIYFGDNVYMNFDCVILDCARVDIGANTMFAPGVHIYAATHPVLASERIKGPELAKPVKIGNNVWIGGRSVICPGVTIGDNTTIGAGSVVTKDIPANCVAAGNPAKIIRYLPAPEGSESPKKE